jgi:hypothetical protein
MGMVDLPKSRACLFTDESEAGRQICGHRITGMGIIEVINNPANKSF